LGAALFIVGERPVDGLDTFVDGKALTRCRPYGAKQRLGRQADRHLDALAQQAGVRPLMEFFSASADELMAWLDESGKEPPPGGFPPTQWFSAADGLATVRGLIAHLEANPEAAEEVDQLLSDLRQFEEVLQGLDTAGVRWHLSVDT
jgi:hypothetical protein